MIRKPVFILLLSLLSLLLSCVKDKVEFIPTPYNLKVPDHFPQMPIPVDNPLTNEGVLLGRHLFYEKKLSRDNSISCASCHAQAYGFSDPNQFSSGVNGTLGNRNAMALINLGWQEFFFWDGRVATLEHQILEPVPNPIEMHQSWKEALDKLEDDITYRQLFFKAFGTPGLDSLRASKAIAQFLRTLISGNSKFDVMYRYSNNMNLNVQQQVLLQSVTPEEWAGYDLFKSLNGADCFHCHNGPLMQVQKYSNNGLDFVPNDKGRALVTGLSSDNGKFKVPTLRNIALTGPYMHDGRFTSLEEVINHYSSGVKQSATIDPLIEFAFQGGVQLTSEEKSYLLAFLNTLTDYTFLSNPDFQDPH